MNALKSSWRLPAFLVIAAVAVALLRFDAPRPAVAASFTVTKAADTNDGTCDADCSLREAIGAANASPGSTVTIPAGTYTLTRAGGGEEANATGDLDVTANMTITGAGSATTIIDAGAIDNVIDVHGVDLTISGVTLQGGVAGPGWDGDGIAGTTGTIDLTNVVSRNNAGSGVATAGADVTASSVDLSGNGDAGVVTSGGNIDITDSTINNNSSDAIVTLNGNVTLDGVALDTSMTITVEFSLK